MNVPTGRWTVRLAETAEADFAGIVNWTAARFGAAQALAYAETLSAAITELAYGPTIPGAVARDDIGKGIGSLHVARNGRKGRHFVIFRVTKVIKVTKGRNERMIDVLRLLHDAMDLARHVPSLADDE